MIETRLLRYALAAADTGSFSRAADQFNIKQSTLSKSVQYLEARLGLLLFRRSTRGVVPTDAGERFLTRARSIVLDISSLDQETLALAKGEAGILRIGFHASLARGNLSATLRAYRDAAPDVDIEAREGGRTELLASLSRGTLDLAVTTGNAARPWLHSLRLWSEPIVIAMVPDHPAARCDPLYWTDLRDAAFLVTRADPGPDISALIAARLSSPGRQPGIFTQDVSGENILTFVTGRKVAAVTGLPHPHSRRSEAIVFREVHDASGPACLDQSVHWRHDNDNPAMRRFLGLLCDRYGRPIP